MPLYVFYAMMQKRQKWPKAQIKGEGPKRAPHSVEFYFSINCDRQKRFLQNERRRADLQHIASDFLGT